MFEEVDDELDSSENNDSDSKSDDYETTDELDLDESFFSLKITERKI